MKKKIILIISSIIFIAIVLFVIQYKTGFSIMPKKSNVQIFKSKVKIEAAKNIELKLVETSNDIYSMKIPEGWKIETTGEYETFGFRLFDPNNSARQIFYYGKFSPFLKNNNGKQFWNNYMNNSGYASSKYLADAYVLNPATVETFYSNFDNFTKYAVKYGIKHNFPLLGQYEVLERINYKTTISSVASDEAILRLLLTQNKVPCEALVTASVVNAMTTYANNGVDTGYYNVYVVSGIIAPADEYSMLEDILSESLSSFTFTDKYIDQGVNQNKWETETAVNIGKMLSETNDAYNNAWRDRQKSSDAISQKRSDNNLGYDRIYDKETGNTYRAEIGFYDEYKKDPESYTNPNLEMVPYDNTDLYTKKISGYIN